MSINTYMQIAQNATMKVYSTLTDFAQENGNNAINYAKENLVKNGNYVKNYAKDTIVQTDAKYNQTVSSTIRSWVNTESSPVIDTVSQVASFSTAVLGGSMAADGLISLLKWENKAIALAELLAGGFFVSSSALPGYEKNLVAGTSALATAILLAAFSKNASDASIAGRKVKVQGSKID